ncbi:HNH endonuclease signature motif containing protein [Aliarcobacter skirrowii]|uniref:HNH endonuclease signature motif containing protein n=1 Tax=Aliarcobacter skirrowii TaxID=28200 RepID=UPI0029B1978F|nr:HNH endonuclease signature motif containing protein [Aliarcobacter skirrowii]MDX4065009.1 HNH endonuclease signature motif containing protein [Aliarcobacter skirrowii]
MAKKQKYEKYWELTVEYTDINEEPFLKTLEMIVEYIDNHNMTEYDKKKYKELQNIVNRKYPKEDMRSVRKSINQFVKLGFVNHYLKSYHHLTKDFLNAKSQRKRRNIFSNIFYSNSKLSASVTKPSEVRHINFLIKTLEEVGSLSKQDIEGLITVNNLEDIKKGYLTRVELDEAIEYATRIGFKLRKYNQIGYVFNFLNKLEGILFVDDILYFEEDAKQIFGEDLIVSGAKKRDYYLHRLYKEALKTESEEKFGKVICMLEKLDYPVLIASHIKPFIDSNDDEAYDPNNGLLLSRTIDSLFDLNYITFNDKGNIIFSEKLSSNIVEKWKDYSLDLSVLNSERLTYLKYHNSKLK